MRAAISRFDPNGSSHEIYANGLLQLADASLLVSDDGGEKSGGCFIKDKPSDHDTLTDRVGPSSAAACQRVS